MADQNQEPIPLGGSTSEGASVVPSPAPSETAVTTAPPVLPIAPEDSKKKNHPIVFVIMGLFALIVLAAIAVGVTFLFATSDTMPKAPEVKGDMQNVVQDSALEMIKDHKIRLDSNDVNIFLGEGLDKFKDNLAEQDIQINDLFAVISNDKATVYCRANYKGVTWPLKVTADVSFDNPYIIFNLTNAYVGKISLPRQMVMDRLDGQVALDNVSFHNGMIYFDTTDFNEQMSDLALKELGLTVEEEPESTDEEGFSITKWFGKLFKGAKNKVKEYLGKKVRNIIHNVQFQDVKVIDNELVISVTYDEEKPTDDAATDAEADDAA